MQISFYIPERGLDETKQVIRSLDSLRFLNNPFQIGNKYHIYLSGDVEDVNKLDEHLATYHPQEEPKQSIKSKLTGLISKIFSKGGSNEH